MKARSAASEERSAPLSTSSCTASQFPRCAASSKAREPEVDLMSQPPSTIIRTGSHRSRLAESRSICSAAFESIRRPCCTSRLTDFQSLWIAAW